MKRGVSSMFFFFFLLTFLWRVATNDEKPQAGAEHPEKMRESGEST